MNGKYYGQREIRWHSREKDRLERIEKERVSKNEKNQGKNHIHRSSSRHMA
jgi:hypothetical protein